MTTPSVQRPLRPHGQSVCTDAEDPNDSQTRPTGVVHQEEKRPSSRATWRRDARQDKIDPRYRGRFWLNIQVSVVLARWLSNSSPAPLVRAIRAYRGLDLTSATAVKPVAVPKRAKILNASEPERIREKYVAGDVTTAELGQEFGVDRQTVQRKLRAMGVRMYGNALTPDEVERAIELYLGGLPVKKVAQALGRGETGVRNALIRAGVQLRDTRGRNRC